MGSHLCDELVKNFNVIALDDFSGGDEMNIDHLLANPNFAFVRHDINNLINLETLPELERFKIKFHGIAQVYHLACPTSPKNFTANKIATILVNSYGLKNVLDLALHYKAKLLHFSSTVVYGPRRESSLKTVEEDLGLVDQIGARSSYDESKRFAETMVVNYREVYGLDAKIIRFARIYGPRMRLNNGHMIPDFIVNALEEKDLVIFGDDDFNSTLCYVKDAIDAAIKIMNTELIGPINVGSDIDVNMTVLAQKIIDIIGAKSKILHKEKLLFMSSLCRPDITKARNDLGGLPIVILEKGLEKTIEALRARRGLIRFN